MPNRPPIGRRQNEPAGSGERIVHRRIVVLPVVPRCDLSTRIATQIAQAAWNGQFAGGGLLLQGERARLDSCETGVIGKLSPRGAPNRR